MAQNPLTNRVAAFKFRAGSRGAARGLDLCSFLPEPAKSICRGVGDFVRGPGRPPPPPTFAPVDCDPGFVFDPFSGTCKPSRIRLPDIDPGTLSPAEASISVGEAVMGRFGAGLVPGNRVINRAVCLSGMQLGRDGVCYNKSQITNKERMWPAGRKPLLTGGDMRCISTAARAAGRLERTTKRLQKIGLMKKPAPRRKMITSGATEQHHN